MFMSFFLCPFGHIIYVSAFFLCPFGHIIYVSAIFSLSIWTYYLCFRYFSLFIWTYYLCFRYFLFVHLDILFMLPLFFLCPFGRIVYVSVIFLLSTWTIFLPLS